MTTIVPEDIGLASARLQQADALLADAVQRGHIPAAVLAIGRNGTMLPPRAFGSAQADSVFLVASITKPVTATALMQLAEAGQLALPQRVVDFIPAFGQRGKEAVTLWHLLTHTSGLPDMLPQNLQLRAAHAGLDRFVEGICQCDLLFAPGTRVSYQSCGFAMQMAIIEQLTEMRLRDVLHQQLFAPLGMARTALGIRADLLPHLAEVVLPAEQVGTDWHWNSAYWRQLGVPWGGMFATASDLTRLLQAFLAGGTPVLSRATVAAMTRDQLAERGITPEDRPASWGLGWRLRDPRFGDLASPATFGHGGATGTLFWADPERRLTFVLLTTQPAIWQGQLLARLSNIASAACL